MGNEYRTGFHITPLTLWVAGGLGALLWGVLFAIGMSNLQRQSTMQDNVTTLVTSQRYDRLEIDAIKNDVKSVQAEVRGIADRLGKVESRR